MSETKEAKDTKKSPLKTFKAQLKKGEITQALTEGDPRPPDQFR
jgi:hypothetical protein